VIAVFGVAGQITSAVLESRDLVLTAKVQSSDPRHGIVIECLEGQPSRNEDGPVQELQLVYCGLSSRSRVDSLTGPRHRHIVLIPCCLRSRRIIFQDHAGSRSVGRTDA
jgi:hypothetical protein